MPKLADPHNQYQNLCYLRKSLSVFQADVYAIDINEQRYVVKDFSRSPWVLKVLFLRRLLLREYVILQKLQAIKGIPEPGVFLDKDKFTLQYVAGKGALARTKKELQTWGITMAFFGEFRQVVEEMHRTGVVHGDIRRRNILVGENGPHLIDFGTALYCGRGAGYIRKRIYKFVQRIDRLKVLELQESYFPGTLTADERSELNHPPGLLVFGKFLRHRIYRVFIKPARWHERWARLTEKFRACISLTL